MKKLFIKILALVILSSFMAETAIMLFDKSAIEITATTEKEDSEKKTEEEKTEKETEKDKINNSFRHRLHTAIKLQHNGLHLSIVTSAFLSLPEIPPDQA